MRKDRFRSLVNLFRSISSIDELLLILLALRYRGKFNCPEGIFGCIAPLGGDLGFHEAGLLYWIARNWPVEGPVIELGSFAGKSTIVLASTGRKVHAVDAWSLEVDDPSAYHKKSIKSGEIIFRDFFQNLAKSNVATSVTVHRGLTNDVVLTWKEQAALLFIDAGHTYTNLRDDLANWTPFLHQNGILLIHDVVGSSHPGVKRAASELLRQGWSIRNRAGSIVAFTRRNVED